MASKIQSHHVYVAITPYKMEGQTFDEVDVMTAYDDSQKHFYVNLHPGWKTDYGHGCFLYGGDDPLTDSKWVKVKDSPKNSQKTINEIGAAMEMAKDAIAWLFDKRDWQRLYVAVRNIALFGYTDKYRQQMEKLMGKEEPKTEVSEPLKTWGELKKKHPDAMLLFRCGDFYECYQDDADEVAKVCGITLTKAKGLGATDFYRMAGFPHHALDTYLPKLVRAGKRVAICDEITINNNSKNSEDKDMRLNMNANNNETKNVAMEPQVNNNPIEDAQAVEIKGVDVPEVDDIKPQVVRAAVKAANGGEATTIPMGQHGSIVIAGVGNNREPLTVNREPKKVQDSVPGSGLTRTDTDGGGKLTRVTFGTYKTKKGADAPIITGFADDNDPRWKRHFDAKPKWVSAGYRRDLEGNKAYHLLFGTKYMAVAKALADAYNTTDRKAWEAAEQACADNYNGIVEGYQQAKAERKAERAAAKAAKAAEKTNTNRTNDTNQPTAGYSAQDVAAMLQKVLAGGELPKDVEALMKKAA